MTQYLLAIWDYEAEGEFELSFKQGDIIKLLEKHNEDWWEGEMNEEIGFFPANRIRLNTPEEPDQHKNQKNAVEEGPPALPPRKQSLQPDTVPIPKFTESTPTNDVIESPLPQGWEHAYAEDGTIYYFNEFTGQSRWDKPTDNEEEDEEEEDEEEEDDGPPRDESMETFIQGLQPEELKKLEFNQLQPEWIRRKGYIQMKMISEKNDSGSKLSSWKVYYGVLSNGFLLLYKEGHVKNKKSSKAQLPVGSFDLDSCKIDPAGKQDTKRKHVFIISTPKRVKLYVQTTGDKEFSSWLDAIMRELIARKERPNEDTEILRLLKSLTFDDSNMKVNKKMSKEEDTKKKTHWFSPKPVEKRDNFKKIESTYGQTQPSGKDDIFGGLLQMEENGDIPLVVKLCITEVEKRGLESVGIYRLSGPASTIQKYRAAFNNKETVSFKDEHDINAVTGLLKLYFRELRNPLMTHEYYEYFMEAARITDYEDRMYQIKSIIHSLPKPNYTVLEYLMRHLGLVASYSDINKMESSNLALIFSVGLLRSPQEDLSSIMMSDLQSKIVEAIIQQVDWFFEADEEEEQEENNHV